MDAVDLTTEAVRELYATLLEIERDGGSSNDWVQAVDDWFTGNGFPTIIYRES